MDYSSTVKNQGLKSYHIYFEDKCLFKNLNQEEFDLIWGRSTGLIIQIVCRSLSVLAMNV